MKFLFSLTFLIGISFSQGASGAATDEVSVPVMEGDSVTLNTGVETKEQEKIIWYFNDDRIAQINGDQSKICTDDQCKERFRDRLKLDPQTGSLTITNITHTDAGVYKLNIIGSRNKIFTLAVHGVFSVGPDGTSAFVMEGDSVTLNSGVETKEQEKIRWYFNDDHIALITGDLSKICTDVQCNKGTEIFRDRLKLDHQTGSLTITNITHTDAGVYTLNIISSSSRKKIFTVAVHGVFGVGTDGKSAFVMEGDSVTLNTGVQTNQQEKIIWYYNTTRIALITGDLSKICTDVQCNEGTERFRDRLKLDNQTGSLTITNTTNTDSGEYKLQIIGGSGKIFNITVRDVPAAERDEMKRKSVKEGESVTFDTRVIKHPNDVMMWYFNDTLIAEITGDQSKICTDDERFRDRLKLDHQTGSLTIMDTTNTHSGEYKLQINSGSISIIKTFSSFIRSVTGPSSAAEAGISAEVIVIVVVVVVLLVAAVVAGVICYRRHQGNGNTDNRGENKNVKECRIPMVHNGTVPTAETPLLPDTDGTVPTAETPLSPDTDGTVPTAETPLLPDTDGTVPPAETPLSPDTDGTVPTAETPLSPDTDGTGPPAETPLSPDTDGTGPPAETPLSPDTDGTVRTVETPLLPDTDGMVPPSADTHIDANGTKQ